MTLYENTITKTMSAIATRLQPVLDDSWYLAGGTALALQIGHRASVDLDYFCTHSFDTNVFRENLQHTFDTAQISFDFETKDTLWCTIDGVKVSFIARPIKLLQPPMVSNQFILAGFSDITVMKLLALCSREEYKDYVDLACLSRVTDVRLWPEWWNEVYPNQDLTSWLMALSSVSQVPEIPLVYMDAFEVLPVVATVRSVVTELTAYIEKMSA